MTQALAITAWSADLSTSWAFTALRISVLDANAASAMGPGSSVGGGFWGAVAADMTSPRFSTAAGQPGATVSGARSAHSRPRPLHRNPGCMQRQRAARGRSVPRGGRRGHRSGCVDLVTTLPKASSPTRAVAAPVHGLNRVPAWAACRSQNHAVGRGWPPQPAARRPALK
jgi:hypothetical protein